MTTGNEGDGSLSRKSFLPREDPARDRSIPSRGSLALSASISVSGLLASVAPITQMAPPRNLARREDCTSQTPHRSFHPDLATFISCSSPDSIYCSGRGTDRPEKCLGVKWEVAKIPLKPFEHRSLFPTVSGHKVHDTERSRKGTKI